jgi:hypothetical protein
MILFISPNPNTQEEHEGYFRRVAAIDKLFRGEKKLYFDDIENYELKAKAIIEANLIYVHSIYQAKKILENYPLFKDKIITDLHGIVPEEEAFAGNVANSKIMNEVEKRVFKYCKNFVVVSEQMRKHFINKYNLKGSIKWIVLPIFDEHENHSEKSWKTLSVVYAGGSQKWQRTDLIVESINKTYEKYNFKILTHQPEAFSDIISNAKKNVLIKSVNPVQVGAYYKDSHMGFILRDDIPLNNVSCPTKLIEYLSNDIVPIVLSPSIGDFRVLGYSYIKLDDFLARSISRQDLTKAMQANREVLLKLRQIVDQGRQALIKLSKGIKPSENYLDKKLLLELVIKNCQLDEMRELIENKQNQIDSQIVMIEDYAKAVEFHRSELQEIRSSKSWRIANILSNKSKSLRK